jgi:hypothetical protein
MKIVNNCFYIHANYADKAFSDNPLYAAAKAKVAGFVYTIVKFDKVKNAFSFTYSPDFDTALEPLVSDSITVQADLTTKFSVQQADPFIYHGKHFFIEPDYAGFSYAESEQRYALIQACGFDKTRIGRLSFWINECIPVIAKMLNTVDNKSIGQWLVDFVNHKPVLKNGSFAQYILTKADVLAILSDFNNAVVWDNKTGGKMEVLKRDSFHPTARARTALTKPIAEYLKKNTPASSVLYHGCGRDSLGADVLKADVYDPYHPLAQVRIEPTKQYMEIHSHYTLNVVDRNNGFEVLKDIYKLLADNGKVVISVRRDFVSE